MKVLHIRESSILCFFARFRRTVDRETAGALLKKLGTDARSIARSILDTKRRANRKAADAFINWADGLRPPRYKI